MERNSWLCLIDSNSDLVVSVNFRKISLIWANCNFNRLSSRSSRPEGREWLSPSKLCLRQFQSLTHYLLVSSSWEALIYTSIFHIRVIYNTEKSKLDQIKIILQTLQELKTVRPSPASAVSNIAGYYSR